MGKTARVGRAGGREVVEGSFLPGPKNRVASPRPSKADDPLGLPSQSRLPLPADVRSLALRVDLQILSVRSY